MVVIQIRYLESKDFKLENKDSPELELTCDGSYFRYCKYRSDHEMKWKSDFDRDGDRILYRDKKIEELG